MDEFKLGYSEHVENALLLDCDILAAGDEIFIPRQVRHSVKNVHSATTRWLFGYDGAAAAHRRSNQ